jgi:hypothetical protein
VKGQGFGASAALLLLSSIGCSSVPRAEPGSVTAAPAVDARAVVRVEHLAQVARSWLARRYGPPRVATGAAIRLVPDARALAGEGEARAVDALPGLSWRPGDRDLSLGHDDPPTILLAPSFGHWGRPDAIARWLFYVEWTRDLPPWLREGLSETVGAAFAADFYPNEHDRNLDGLLPSWAGGARPPFPDVARLAAADATEAAREFVESARVVAAATEGGADVTLVKQLLESPPLTREALAAFAATAREEAASFPRLPRVLEAIERRPRASSTTALVEAATPPELVPGTDPAPPDGLEAHLAALAASSEPLVRRLAIYGLGRLPGERARRLVVAASRDPNPLVRAASVAARARALDRAVGRDLLELAKDSPTEEAPGRRLATLALFDRLTGFRDPPPDAEPELSLASVLGGMGVSPGWRPSYKEVSRRESWLAGGGW